MDRNRIPNGRFTTIASESWGKGDLETYWSVYEATDPFVVQAPLGWPDQGPSLPEIVNPARMVQGIKRRLISLMFSQGVPKTHFQRAENERSDKKAWITLPGLQ